jgi:hypothetical protein
MIFRGLRATLTAEEWIDGLQRIPYREDLPITLQGGEPMLFKDLGRLLSGLPHYFDLLTNFALEPARFAHLVGDGRNRLMRRSPYPSIRVSYHPAEMGKAWKNHGFEELVRRCVSLADHGFRVSPIKANSDVGIYMVAHPDHRLTDDMIKACQGRLPIETKEFLGVHNGKLYGSYRYPYSTNLLEAGIYPDSLKCECRTTELLIDPLGFVWGCHFYLYEAWKQGIVEQEFSLFRERRYRFDTKKDFLGRSVRPIGHILDPEFSMEELNTFRPCTHYGRCIGCDTKVKNNRFQSLDDRNIAHTSVVIRNIEMPEELQNHSGFLSHHRKYLRR